MEIKINQLTEQVSATTNYERYDRNLNSRK